MLLHSIVEETLTTALHLQLQMRLPYSSPC
jgi:hypothetical protein